MNATIIVLAVVVIVLVAAVGWLLYERQRSDRLRSDFGPEYKRTVAEAGSRRAAEAELEERQRRVQSLSIRPLAEPDRVRLAGAWRRAQARFVDQPEAAIADADRLIGEVMQLRGYPVADFEQRVADISVDHPSVVEHYRAAHAIATRSSGIPADTEQLRQAMIHYRALFDDLLGGGDSARQTGGAGQSVGTPSASAEAARPAGTTSPANEPTLTRRTQ